MGEEPAKKKKGCLKNFLIILIGGIICASVLINSKSGGQKADDDDYQQVTPQALWQAYNTNMDAANEKYFGKKVLLTVQAPFPVDRNDAGSLFTVFATDKKGNGVIVFLSDSNAKKLMGFAPLTKVCITGKVERIDQEKKKLIIQLSSKSVFEAPN